METKRKIKFVTSETKEKNAKGLTCYQGQLRHNLVLNEKESKEWFADYCGEPSSRTTRYVDALGEFIAQCVRNGTRLDFGAFSVGLKLRGSFAGQNAPFDPAVHSVSVELTPGKDMKRAVNALNPINVTDIGGRWHLTANRQTFPFEIYDTFAADGLRKIEASGIIPPIHPEATDEGIWVENDEGVRLLTGEVTHSEFARTVYTLTGPLPRGDHWVVALGRYLDQPAVIQTRRRVHVE